MEVIAGLLVILLSEGLSLLTSCGESERPVLPAGGESDRRVLLAGGDSMMMQSVLTSGEECCSQGLKKAGLVTVVG